MCKYVQKRRTNEWRLLRGGSVCVSVSVCVYLMRHGGDDDDDNNGEKIVGVGIASLASSEVLKISVLFSTFALVFVSRFSLCSLPIDPFAFKRVRQETISYRRCIKMCKCMSVGVCVSVCFLLSLFSFVSTISRSIRSRSIRLGIFMFVI